MRVKGACSIWRQSSYVQIVSPRTIRQGLGNDIFHLFLLLCSIVVQESVEKFNAARRFASGEKMVRLDRISKRSGSCPIAGILQIIPNDEVPPLQSQ